MRTFLYAAVLLAGAMSAQAGVNSVRVVELCGYSGATCAFDGETVAEGAPLNYRMTYPEEGGEPYWLFSLSLVDTSFTIEALVDNDIARYHTEVFPYPIELDLFAPTGPMNWYIPGTDWPTNEVGGIWVGSFPDQKGERYTITVPDFSVVPEPGTPALILLGLAGVAVAARRRRA
jgi:PEP-CTERM motif